MIQIGAREPDKKLTLEIIVETACRAVRNLNTVKHLR